MARYRARSGWVEAYQWIGAQDKALDDFLAGGSETIGSIAANVLTLTTTEGDVVLNPGDFIVRCYNGLSYACPRNLFAATYRGA